MLLTGITSGTEIIFTDGCYKDSTGSFFYPAAATSDWVFKWQASGAMNAGTQIKFWTSTVNCSGNCGANASAGSITSGRGLSIPSSGDQIFACQGGTIDTASSTRTYAPGTVLTGIHTNLLPYTTTSNWDGGTSPANTSNSELPNSLTTYTNAIWHKYIGVGANGEVDNLRYKCTVTSGTAAAIRAATMDTANWDYLDGVATSFSPATCTPVTTTTWNGATWSTTPSSSLDAIIASSTTPGAFTCEDLTINSGVALTLGSGVTATIGGDVTNNGNGTSGTGTLRFVKSGTQSLNGTAFTHSGVVEVATGATLTTNSKLTMANNASLMHGTSTSNGGGSISGSVAFQKTIGSTTKGWRMFALPVDALIDNFETGLNTLCSNHTPSTERNVYYYDATAGATAPGGNYAVGWTQANNSSDDENKAYSIYLDNNSHSTWNFSSTVEISGTPNDGSKTFNLQYHYDPASTGNLPLQRGWNMIPNYFPSVLGVYNLINDGNFGTTYKAVHVYDQGTSQMVGLNQSSLNTYNNSGISRFSTVRQIPLFTAFWVKATSTSQSIQLKNSMRITRTDSIMSNTYFKKAFDVFRVEVKDAEGKADQFSVCFDEAATDGMDYTMDIYKFKSFSDEVPTLYTELAGEGMLSLNAVPVRESYTMPLYMESFKNDKEYTFSPIIEEYLGYFDVELVDNKTGVKTQLLTNNYSFKHDAAYKGARFTLNFTKKSTTSIDELYSQEKMYAHTNEEGINVVYNNNNQAANAVVEIYNIMGQKLFTSNTITGGETVTYKPVNTAQTNVYIAHVTSNGKTKTIKVVY